MAELAGESEPAWFSYEVWRFFIRFVGACPRWRLIIIAVMLLREPTSAEGCHPRSVAGGGSGRMPLQGRGEGPGPAAKDAGGVPGPPFPFREPWARSALPGGGWMAVRGRLPPPPPASLRWRPRSPEGVSTTTTLSIRRKRLAASCTSPRGDVLQGGMRL